MLSSKYLVLGVIIVLLVIMLVIILYVLFTDDKKSQSKKEEKKGTPYGEKELLLTKHVTIKVERKLTPLNELAKSEIGQALEMDESVNDELITLDIDFDDYETEDISSEEIEELTNSIDNTDMLKSIFESMSKELDKGIKKNVDVDNLVLPLSLEEMQSALNDEAGSDDVGQVAENEDIVERDELLENIDLSDEEEINEIKDTEEEDFSGFEYKEEEREEPDF